MDQFFNSNVFICPKNSQEIFGVQNKSILRLIKVPLNGDRNDITVVYCYGIFDTRS